MAGPTGGVYLPPDPGAWERTGHCGNGGSVVGDGCSVAIKDSSSPHPSGRFDPNGGSWLDSQDISKLVWTVEHVTPFKSLTFALTDAFDQGYKASAGGHSYFNLAVDGATWSIPSREANGTLHWLKVVFSAPTTLAKLAFHTRQDDGFGVSSVHLSPVPVPASGLLIVGGVAMLGWLRRRSAAAA